MDVLLGQLKDVEQIVELAQDAEREGHRMVSSLIADWRSGVNRFDGPGECLFMAMIGDEVIGVCGLNVDPYVSNSDIGRVRRLYVKSDRRRLSVGSMLVDQTLESARGRFERLRIRTYNPIASAFYLSRGFEAVEGDEFCTHELALVRESLA